MTEDVMIRAFNSELDRMLGCEPGSPTPDSNIPSSSQELLALAARLSEVDFENDMHPRPDLRARWISRSNQITAKPGPVHRRRWVWLALALAALLAALFIFRQPVLAAVGRLLGYGYFPEVGFVQLDTARVLPSPVRQEHAGRSLTVLRGLAMPEQTTLWLEYSDAARPADGTWLETPAGEHITLLNWSWDPDQPDTRGVRLEFPPLPAGAGQTTLALPEGWRLPLEWIPASQSNLPDVRVVPYSEPTGQLIAEPTRASTATPDLCIEQHGLKLCVLAATASAENTSVLVEAQSSNPRMTPGNGMQGLVWQTEAKPATLRDAQGNAFPMSGQQAGTLTFPAITGGNQELALSLPAILATVDFSPQVIRVDVGEDPQPGQVIPLDADIQVLGATVRFRKATFVGDGVSSLRLTLDAEPVETVDGMTPIMLEMGKPERVDDLYGSGNLAGSKDLFVELVRPQGKITGVLELPVIQATVAISGPFDFTFSLSQMAPQASPTPEVADPGSFSPAPTPTALALDTYRYTGRMPQPGDLLFTVVGEKTTSLYAASPNNQFEPDQVATLPGQVYQVYLYPDRLGIDYLAGSKVNEDGFIFYRSAQLFTLRFEDARPHLLAAFPRGPENVKGTELTADWSYDGRLMIFQLSNFYPKQGESPSKIGWIDLACRQTGDCQPRYLDIPAGLQLYRPHFSPTIHQVLISGFDETQGSHMSDVYSLEFNAGGQPGTLTNLTNSDQVEELYPNWLPDGKGFFTTCWDNTIPVNEYDLCQYGAAPGPGLHLLRLPGNMHDITLSPDGKRLVEYAYIKNQEQMRVFDLDTRQTTLIPEESSRPFTGFAFSEDGNFLTLLKSGGAMVALGPDQSIRGSSQISLYSFSTGQDRLVFDSGEPGNISWSGWAR